MPLEIKFKCPKCGISIWWVYEEEKELYPSELIGCPAEGCLAIHDINIREIDAQRAEELRQREPFTW